jgi:hypothetical protein
MIADQISSFHQGRVASQGEASHYSVHFTQHVHPLRENFKRERSLNLYHLPRIINKVILFSGGVHGQR